MMSVRRARPADAAAIGAIHVSTWRNAYAGVLPDDYLAGLSPVRHAVGYRRLKGLDAAAALARLYGLLRLFVNHFQPSFKLASKARDGARVRKRYHPPATPYQRLLADARTSDATRRRAEAVHATYTGVPSGHCIRRSRSAFKARSRCSRSASAKRVSSVSTAAARSEASAGRPAACALMASSGAVNRAMADGARAFASPGSFVPRFSISSALRPARASAVPLRGAGIARRTR